MRGTSGTGAGSTDEVTGATASESWGACTDSVSTRSGEGAGALSIVQQSMGPDAQHGSVSQNGSAVAAGTSAIMAVRRSIAVSSLFTIVLNPELIVTISREPQGRGVEEGLRNPLSLQYER